jgi:hypothetical protein
LRIWPVLFAAIEMMSLSPFTCRGAALTPGNILVVCDTSFVGVSGLYEYTPNGQLVQSFTVLRPPTETYADPRDIDVGTDGRVFVYNGTFSPSVSILNPSSGWEHRYAGMWATVGNGSYGGIDVDGSTIYVGDNYYGNGIVRFTADGSTAYSHNGAVTDVALGPKNTVYGLIGTGSPTGTSVSVFDRSTLTKIRDIQYSFDYYIFGGFRGLVVAEDESMYLTADRGTSSRTLSAIVHVDKNGGLINYLNLPEETIDIDFLSDGSIVSGSRTGPVYILDRGLIGYRKFSTATDRSGFIAPIPYPVPEPVKLNYILLLVMGCHYVRYRAPRPHHECIPRFAAALLARGRSNFEGIGAVSRTAVWSGSARSRRRKGGSTILKK